MIKKILFILPHLCLVSWLYAGTISVSTLSDSGTGSLRQAITNATAGDVISIDIAGTITLSSELPTINRTITITGNSAGTIIDGNSSCRIFTVQLATGTVTLSGLNLMNGYSSIGAAAGLFAITGNNALVAISNCTFSGCSTTGSEAYGGAIATSADMTLTNCTIYGNSAATSGGALATLSGCTVTILNCTIYNNATTSSSGTGGFDITTGATVSVQNTILAGNTADTGNSYSDLLTSGSGVLTSLGYNLSNTTPFSLSSDLTGKDLTSEIKLSALTLNASSGMYVCTLQEGSVAIDQANSTAAPTLDQCGQSRKNAADIGAYENQTSIPATITTQDVSDIGTTTATGNGNITSLGSSNPTSYGVCWNTTGTPTISDSLMDNGAASATGAFTASMTGLSANTTYYVRAYATNKAGTSYGTSVTFTTSALAPTVTTQTVSNIGTTTATGNGNITSLGAPNPTAYGVCWNTTGTPTISDSKVDNGAASATGAFTASMTGLSANTTYYVRAYATNKAGTSYGTSVTFTTSALAPTVTTQTVSNIGTTTAIGNGNITSLGAPNPSASGVCWNTTGTPTISDSKVDNGAVSVIGPFTAVLNGLTANTTYYVKAYAVNTAGTVYGEEVTFTTLSSIPTNLAVPGSTIASGTVGCFNAYDTITVAASDPVILESGSSVEMIAGKSILFLPGFHAESGSYLYAHITSDSTFCDGDAESSTIAATPDEKSLETDKLVGPSGITTAEKSIKVYPNPNNGLFTLELENVDCGSSVCLYNLLGSVVYRSMTNGEPTLKINLPGIRKGVYFVKVADQEKQLTKKIVVD